MKENNEVVVYAHEVGATCPFCGSVDIYDVYDDSTPDAEWLGMHCFNCQTSYPPKPDPGIMDDDDEIPF